MTTPVMFNFDVQSMYILLTRVIIPHTYVRMYKYTLCK